MIESSALPVDPAGIALADYGGESAIDQQITRLQASIRADSKRMGYLEQLGWLFVSKARQSSDPGWYKVAEQCAAALEARDSGSAGAQLLRGHIHEALHRFKEAEMVARRLVEQRPWAPAYGLLGDALMEQGRLDEAVAAYQSMVDLKPSLESYSRVAHMRWLTGDLDGAIEIAKMALGAGNSRDPEPLAWVLSRLALYQLQAGHFELAMRPVNEALALLPDYPAALLAKGRILLAQKEVPAAIELLTKAAAANPLPEYQWTLADALRADGRSDAAGEVEKQLRRRGATGDPRTYALFLATRSEDTAAAVALAREELATRGDILTHDALAWALLADGHAAEAWTQIQMAMSAGTADARLHFHYGVIAAANGRVDEAVTHSQRAREIEQMLLPSEREGLSRQIAQAETIPVAYQPVSQNKTIQKKQYP